MSAPAPTVTGLLLAQAGRERPGLLFEDRRWSWREHVGECARYAAALRARRRAGRPFHVGVLAEPRYADLLPVMDVPVLPLDGLELPGQAPLDSAPAAPDDLLMPMFHSNAIMAGR